MAKYYYVPLFLSPSMRQPGSRPTLSAYTPGITDPVTGVTTSAVAAITAAGIDLSAYSIFHGSTLPGVIPAETVGRIPMKFGSGNPQNGGEQMRSSFGSFPSGGPGTLGPTSYRNASWPNDGFGAGTLGTESFAAGEGVFGGEVNTPNAHRTDWARTPILYVDTVRRMVIETPDAFVDGPFIANGWVQRTAQQVNRDYPNTIQGPNPGQDPP